MRKTMMQQDLFREAANVERMSEDLQAEVVAQLAACYRTDPRMHHALVDARAYRRDWLAWMDNRKRNGR